MGPTEGDPVTASPPVEPPRRLLLDADDWRFATWLNFPVPAPQEPRPFDQEACCQMLRQIAVEGWWYDKLPIAPGLSAREAVFWLQVGDIACSGAMPVVAATRLAQAEIPDQLDDERLRDAGGNLALFCVRTLRRPEWIVEWLADGHQDSGLYRTWFNRHLYNLSELHNRFVPLLTATERAEYRDALSRHLRRSPADRCPCFEDLLPLAALIGMPDELRPLIASWQRSPYGLRYRHFRAVLGLKDGDEVVAEMRRLGGCPGDPLEVRAWLATTGCRALNELETAFIRQDWAPKAMEIAACFDLVEAPEMVPVLLSLQAQRRGGDVARNWLARNPIHVVIALAPQVLAGDAAAIQRIRGIARTAGDAIAAALPCLPADQAAAVRAVQTASSAPPGSAVDAATIPWFAAAGKGLRAGELPPWAAPADLPPIRCAGGQLGEAETLRVLHAMRAPASGARLLVALKEHADRQSLDAFAWEVFEAWQHDASPSAQRWAMTALGDLGSDASAIRLAALIRVWPGQRLAARASAGIEVLRRIGSDAALSEIQGLTSRLRFKGLKAKASEALLAIAANRGLSLDELGDRIVPDCGLDEHARRSFGSCTCQLGCDGRITVADATGGKIASFPKPGPEASPDELSIAAEWRFFSQQLKAAWTAQVTRLERCMAARRRWTPPDFAHFVVAHPVMSRLARGLVWAAWSGPVMRCFRLDEDGQTVDLDEAPVVLEGCEAVSLPHPLQLDKAERGRWGQQLVDHGLTQPFRQLLRPTVATQPDELAAGAITRFAADRLAAIVTVFGFDKLGWTRCLSADGKGAVAGHQRRFPAAGISAVAQYTQPVSDSAYENFEESGLTCWFIRDGDGPADAPERRLALRDVDLITVSETLHDLTRLATKARPRTP